MKAQIAFLMAGVLLLGYASGGDQGGEPNGTIGLVKLNLGGVVIRQHDDNVYNSENFPGIDPTGVKDSTAAIRQAVVVATGGTLRFAPGQYKVSNPIYLASNTQIVCASTAAVFKPVTGFTVFATTQYARDVLTDLMPTPGNQIDTNIAVQGCGFDFRGITQRYSGPHYDINNAFVAYLAKNVKFVNNLVTGGNTLVSISSGAHCVGVDGCQIYGNTFTSVGVGADVWKGTTNISIHDNSISLLSNPDNFANIYCLAVNGVGTDPRNQEISATFSIANNTCYMNGNAAGIQFDALGPGSQVSHGTISNNTVIRNSGINNRGIYARGRISDVTIQNNTFQDLNGVGILIGAIFTDGGPFTAQNGMSTQVGSSLVQLAIPSLDLSRVAVGNYATVTSASSVGGISLNGSYYLVTAVTSGVSITIDVLTPANATVNASGGNISAQIYWGEPNGIRITGNSFNDCSSPQRAVIDVTAQNIRITANSILGGTYGSFIYSSYIDPPLSVGPFPSSVFGNTGTPGFGILNACGDSVNDYNCYTVPRAQ